MNFLALQQEVASRLRMDQTVSAQATLIQRWLNMSGKEIWAEADWNWTLARQIVQTTNDYTTGTVSVNSGATSVTGSGTTWLAAHVGWFIQFSGSNDWYKVTAVGGATSLTIEAAYTPTTNLSAGTYTLRQMYYTVGTNVEKLLTARQSISPTYIEMVGYRDFDIYRPMPTATGNPFIMIVFGASSGTSGGGVQFTLYPFPQQIENIEIRYKSLYTDLSANTDTPVIPAKWHETVMVEGAIWRGFQYQSTGQPAEEARATHQRTIFLQGLDKMTQQQDFDASFHPVLESRDKYVSLLGPILPFKYGYPQ